jgi:ATPase subunit of ABC transporter with duplicated ATPase domains
LELAGAFFPKWSCEDVIRQRTVIFGRNGCGKSTLVHHLRSASQPDSVVKVETDLELLVSNADYVRENLAGVSTGAGLSSALFVTGSINVEIESNFEAATELRDRLDRLTLIASKTLNSRQKVLKQAQDEARDQVRSLSTGFGAIVAATAENKLREASACSSGEDLDDRWNWPTIRSSLVTHS